LTPGTVGPLLGLGGQGDEQAGSHRHGQLVELSQILELPATHEHLALQRHPQRRSASEAHKRFVGLLASADDQPLALTISKSTSLRLIQVLAYGMQCPWHFVEDLVAPHTDGLSGFHNASSRRTERLAGADGQRPAAEVIAKYAKPGAAAAVYCGPPYLASTRSVQTKRPGLDYACEYATEADHRALAEVLCATPAAVMLSGYPSALYEELYTRWRRLERAVQRPTSNVLGRRGAVATEVIWSNRPLPYQARLLDPEAMFLP
jgi:hypothetical protein